MKLQRYSEFILEKVYLSRTIFKSYNLMVDPYSKVGRFDFELRGGYGKMSMEVQIYGSKEDKQLILRLPHELSHLPEKMNIFKTMVRDVVYILNKNQLGFEFEINTITTDRPPLNEYALIDINKEMDISDLERLAQTTKIVNAKISDMDDLDKLVYYTND